VPVPQGETYFNASPAHNGVVPIQAGQTQTVDIVGWSTAPIDPWKLQLFPMQATFALGYSIDVTRIANGQHATLTLRVPAGTPSGSYAGVQLISSNSFDTSFWPVVVVVP
jgi:hypothetical protein